MLEVRVLWGHPPQPRRGGKEPACRAPRYSKPQLLARLESMKNCGMPLSAYPNNGRPGLETHLRLQPHIFVERCEAQPMLQSPRTGLASGSVHRTYSIRLAQRETSLRLKQFLLSDGRHGVCEWCI